jgi:hypothetical protein
MKSSRGADYNLRKAAEGWEEHVTDVVVVDGSDFSKCMPNTKWKAFIYSDEEISIGLKDVLSTYLYVDQYDFYSLYRRALDGKPSEGPRIFRSEIVLEVGNIMPADLKGLNWTHILDGWVLEQEMEGGSTA